MQDFYCSGIFLYRGISTFTIWWLLHMLSPLLTFIFCLLFIPCLRSLLFFLWITFNFWHTKQHLSSTIIVILFFFLNVQSNTLLLHRKGSAFWIPSKKLIKSLCHPRYMVVRPKKGSCVCQVIYTNPHTLGGSFCRKLGSFRIKDPQSQETQLHVSFLNISQNENHMETCWPMGLGYFLEHGLGLVIRHVP